MDSQSVQDEFLPDPLWCQADGCSAPAKTAALIVYSAGVVMGVLACHEHSAGILTELGEIAEDSNSAADVLLVALD